MAQQRNRNSYDSPVRREELRGHFELFIDPASKARFPPEAELRLAIALTLGLLPAYLASAGGKLGGKTRGRAGVDYTKRYGHECTRIKTDLQSFGWDRMREIFL